MADGDGSGVVGLAGIVYISAAGEEHVVHAATARVSETTCLESYQNSGLTKLAQMGDT